MMMKMDRLSIEAQDGLRLLGKQWGNDDLLFDGLSAEAQAKIIEILRGRGRAECNRILLAVKNLLDADELVPGVLEKIVRLP